MFGITPDGWDEALQVMGRSPARDALLRRRDPRGRAAFSAIEDDPADKDLLAFSFVARTNAVTGRIEEAPVAA